ncbi:FmdE family protein [Acetobacterium bakii]|uniref:Formylmethanofuran dehydrogenase n=1 Tax=Acetobacterium bakii TaxID=52689 RepID=A0A0L6TYG4_9FIRM|nr:FmdE family protein [Acetobacterium bakii]KNZ41122.1 formylmethanofuran dehydrogenase [Acetobacterium bakii]
MNEQLWKKSVEFHGHHCPGLAIGVRASQEAIKALNIEFSEDEDVVCITENDACGVDGVQVILGCSAGKGNLIFRNRGKQAFSFFNRKTGESLRLVLKALPEMERDEMEAYILHEPDANNVFDFKKPNYELPERARIFQSVICEVCGEKTAEHMIRLENGKKCCVDCSSPYTRGF